MSIMCKECHGEFEKRVHNNVFCSRRCADVNYYKNNKDRQNYLRLCRKNLNPELYRKNVARQRAEWVKNNPEKCKEIYARWRKKNVLQERLRSRLWRLSHLAEDCANVTRRKARKMRATPPWSDQEKIKEIYRECAETTKRTGVRHEVDHIYPLVSKKCCGLHVPWNLRVITASENRKKHNKMPEEMYVKS